MRSKDLKISIINGPNLNLLGTREPRIYGNRAFEKYFNLLDDKYPEIEFEYYQSNHEGQLIDKMQEVDGKVKGIVLNAGALAHYSYAIADCIAGINTPVIEVHISNVYSRESFRHKSVIAKNCKGIIAGFGMESYRLAIESFHYEL